MENKGRDVRGLAGVACGTLPGRIRRRAPLIIRYGREGGGGRRTLYSTPPFFPSFSFFPDGEKYPLNVDFENGKQGGWFIQPSG